MTEAYRQYIRGIHQLHRLMCAGLGESVQADAVRDRLDRPGGQLTAAERDRAAQFSEDLYAVLEGAVGQQVLHPKKGGVYDVLPPGPYGAAKNCTNGPCDGQRMVVYRSTEDGQLYVREEAEFRQPGRFVLVEAPGHAS